MTTEKLAGMVQRGFTDLGKSVNRGFTKNEEEHSEIVSVLKELVIDLRKIGGDVHETKEIVKSISQTRNLEERVSKLERKVGV